MKRKKYEGFTIVESLLVLAIGGLIFMMTFIAVPTLLANQRDGERRDDMLYFIMQLKKFQTNNNRGALPTLNAQEAANGLTINGSNITFGQTTGTTWADFYSGFFENSFMDPAGTRYNWKIVSCGATKAGAKCTNAALSPLASASFESNNFTMYVVLNATCDGPDAVYRASPRDVAVLYRLERAAVFCANS